MAKSYISYTSGYLFLLSMRLIIAQELPGMIQQHQHSLPHRFVHGLLTIVLFCTLLLVVCACGNTPSPAQTSNNTPSNDQASVSVTATPVDALTRVDWMNYTYRSACYSNTKPFHAQHGFAVNNGIHFTVYQPYYGDLTGDAKPEAIIPYQCSGADTAGKHVQIYSGSAKHPRFLADLPEQKAQGALTNVNKISIAHGQLQLAGSGYSAGTPHCCPDLSIQNSYRWNGKQFVLLQSVANKR